MFRRFDNAPLELPTPRSPANRKLTPSVIQIVGRIIIDGEFSGRTIVLRIGGEIGEATGITIRVPPAWDYSSCLGAISSDLLDTDTRGHSNLDDLMVGLIGAEITLFKINPTNVILECGSIRIEKRFSNQEDSFQIADHDHKKGSRIGQGSYVEESL